MAEELTLSEIVREVDTFHSSPYSHERQHCCAVLWRNWKQIKSAVNENIRLREALEPFAKEADQWASSEPVIPLDDSVVPLIGHAWDVKCVVCDDPDVEGVEDAQFNLGDLREARAALSSGDA